MAIVDTAESAVADAGRRECYLLCKEVKALLPRSQRVEEVAGRRTSGAGIILHPLRPLVQTAAWKRSC